MMNIIYQTAEILATVIEGLILFSVSSEMVGKRFNKKHHTISVLLCTIVYTIIITIMNQRELFSFVTLSTAILLTFLGLLFISTGKIINKLTATVLIWLFVNATDYLISYSLIMIIGKSFDVSQGISLIISPGKTRLLFLILLKVFQIIIFTSCRKQYSKLQLLKTRDMYILFGISTLSYIVMSIITQMIVTDSLLTLQITLIFSVFFILLSIFGSIIAVSMNSKYQNEKQEARLMELTNEMMEKNFITMRDSQNIIRQQVHDFKNHLRTIDGMLDESPTKAYVDELLEESYISAGYCRCGNDVIDSIINCKNNESKEKNIQFTYNISLITKLNISSIDICAVLANQIDNAIEASLKITDLKKRFVKVEIGQKECFVFFKVENSCIDNPFNKNGELITTKGNANGMHGLGLKNIKETTRKHNGELKNEYKNGVFTSIAMLMNNE